MDTKKKNKYKQAINDALDICDKSFLEPIEGRIGEYKANRFNPLYVIAFEKVLKHIIKHTI